MVEIVQLVPAVVMYHCVISYLVYVLYHHDMQTIRNSILLVNY